MAQEFFSRIPWDEWWQEFATALDVKGQLRFRTSWQFAKEKGRTPSERELVYCSIGPKKAEQVWLDSGGSKRLKKAKKRNIPWLGNWQNRRDKLLYYDRESVRKMHTVIKERLDALEAGRGAATVVLDMLAKLTKWSDDVDRYFGHTLLVPSEGKDKQKLTQAVKERTNYYLRLQAMLFNHTHAALQQYLRCHGIADSDLSVLAQMAAVGAKAALAGAAAGQRLAETNPTVHMLATSIAQKAQLLGIEPPTKVIDVDAEEEEAVIPPASSGAEPVRPNGRGSKVVH